MYFFLWNHFWFFNAIFTAIFTALTEIHKHLYYANPINLFSKWAVSVLAPTPRDHGLFIYFYPLPTATNKMFQQFCLWQGDRSPSFNVISVGLVLEGVQTCLYTLIFVSNMNSVLIAAQGFCDASVYLKWEGGVEMSQQSADLGRWLAVRCRGRSQKRMRLGYKKLFIWKRCSVSLRLCRSDPDKNAPSPL